MAMSGGYPAEADIGTYLEGLGLELVTFNNSNFYGEHKQFVWGLLNALGWVLPLGVHLPSPTTFNVRGGDYIYKGTVKTFAPGSAVDPTDSDTTYIWLTPANAVDSAIDGDGWPQSEHVKLAEIDVDADGVITDVRDLRGQSFLRIPKDYITAADVVCKNNEVVCKNNEVVTKA